MDFDKKIKEIVEEYEIKDELKFREYVEKRFEDVHNFIPRTLAVEYEEDVNGVYDL